MIRLTAQDQIMIGPAPPRILVVEDDRSVREAIVEFLNRSGLSACEAENGEVASHRLSEEPFDLIVLDLMLPGEDGLSICRRLATAGPPILIVSAIAGTTDRIVGLEVGAADYLPKPFEPRELLARIRAVLRHSGRPRSGGKKRRFCGLQYDMDDVVLSNGTGQIVSLTAGELRLLQAFLERPGRLLSRVTILDLTRADAAGPFDRAVDLSISRLRKKLKQASGQDPIETVRGGGYRFVASVSSS